jgi:transposase-like protein
MVRTYNRYSICFKEKVVQEVSSGSSISEVSRRYGITGGSTVKNWIKKFGREELLNKVVRIEMKGEQDRLKDYGTNRNTKRKNQEFYRCYSSIFYSIR